MLALVVAAFFGVSFYAGGTDHGVMPLVAFGLLALWLAQWTPRWKELPSRDRLTALIALLTAEELVACGLWWNSSTPTFPLIQGVRQELLVAPVVVCAAVLAIVWARVPLPEWAFPVRGRWLRGALAALALSGLVALGPWAASLMWQAQPFYRAAAVVLLLDVFLYTFWLWQHASRISERRLAGES